MAWKTFTSIVKENFVKWGLRYKARINSEYLYGQITDDVSSIRLSFVPLNQQNNGFQSDSLEGVHLISIDDARKGKYI